MHVVLVTDTFHTGGGLEHLFQTVHALENVDFSIFAKGGDAGCRFRELRNTRVFDQGFGRARLLDRKPDIIHFHHLKPLFHFFAAPWPACKVPLICTAHGLHVRKHEYKRGLRSRVEKRLRGFLERELFQRVDRVIAVSREDAAFLEASYGLGNTTHIANGVDVRRLEEMRSSRKKVLRAFSLPTDATIFLTVARFNFQKGYDVLMEAIRLGARLFREKGIRFVLVGKGEEYIAMRILAERKGIADRVHFLGERTDVYELMKASDLFVLPSRWEGLPYTLLEAFFCGLPIVASDTCGNREIVRDGINGLLFENENPESLSAALASVVHKEERERLSGGTLREEYRLAYDQNATAMRIEAVYRELATGHRAAAHSPGSS